MQNEIDAIINVAKIFKDTLLLPLAQQGMLNADFCKIAVDEFIAELVDRENRTDYAYIDNEGPFKELSPFAHHEFTINGKTWASIEHYIQAAAYFGTDEEFVEHIRTANSSQLAHRRGANGHQSHKVMREDWAKIKDNEMEEAYTALFKQHPKLLDLLKSVGDDKIRYKHISDEHFGWQDDKTGKNMLGKILMDLKVKL